MTYPEKKLRNLSNYEKEEIRGKIRENNGASEILAEEFDCSSSQIAGIKAAMTRAA